MHHIRLHKLSQAHPLASQFRSPCLPCCECEAEQLSFRLGVCKQLVIEASFTVHDDGKMVLEDGKNLLQASI